MSGGAFLTSREVFTNPIWQNIVEFRLFFLIYGNAVFSEEGVKISDDLTLQRGQWLRSTRKLQEDLQYLENRQVKTYSVSTINRTIQRLVRLQRVCTKMHDLGTVFTVLNYEQYQGFGYYKQPELGTQLGTVTEQPRNNNNYVINDINVKDIKPSSSRNKKITYSEDNRYYRMAKYLYDKILNYAAIINKAHLVQNAKLEEWADDFRKMVEIDKRDSKEMQAVIDWCTADPFWQQNILSASKLRKKYVELAIKMNPSRAPVSTAPAKSKADRNKELLQRKMQEAKGLDQGRSTQATFDLFSGLPDGGIE